MPLMKRLFRRLAEQNYYLAKARWMRGQRKAMQAFSGPPIIGYQMGKVGSSTIHASLNALHLDSPVYHVHFLNPRRVHEIEKQRRRYFRTERYGYLKRPWLYEFLYQQIREKDRQWKLITLVRDPIARNISTFFENLEVTKKGNTSGYIVRSDYYDFDIEVDLDHVEPLIELFFNRLVHERPLRYFDDEIRSVFGIDVFAGVFPTDKGYKLYRDDHADLLLIRLEDLDQCAATAFKDFLGIDGFTLISTNVASEKIYAPLYKEFKSRIRLPEDYVNSMYNSRYARHFYSDDEIRGFCYGWGSRQQAVNAMKN